MNTTYLFLAVLSVLFGCWTVDNAFAFAPSPAKFVRVKALSIKGTTFPLKRSSSPSTSKSSPVILHQSDRTETVVDKVVEQWREEEEQGVLQQVAKPSDSYTKGFIAVIFLCILYSTASPLWHFASTQSASPTPPLLLNAANAVVALGGLLTFGGILEEKLPPPPSVLESLEEEEEEEPHYLLNGEERDHSDDELPTSALEAAATAVTDALPEPMTEALEHTSEDLMHSVIEPLVDTDNDDDNSVARFAMAKNIPWGGLELGWWRFLGASAHVFGLSMTTAGHGAFLTQLSTLIVPVIQGLRGETIPNRVKVAVGVALAGVVCLTLDGGATGATQTAAAAAGQWKGDAACVLAAFCYSIYDIQTYKWAKEIPRRELVVSKIATQAGLSVLLCAALSGSDVMTFWKHLDWSTTGAVLIPVVLYSGLVINGFATYLQVNAMNAVGPTRAQTVFASTPLWSAILSYLFLGEKIGVQGAIGGLAFLCALFLASTTPKES